MFGHREDLGIASAARRKIPPSGGDGQPRDDPPTGTAQTRPTQSSTACIAASSDGTTGVRRRIRICGKQRQDPVVAVPPASGVTVASAPLVHASSAAAAPAQLSGPMAQLDRFITSNEKDPLVYSVRAQPPGKKAFRGLWGDVRFPQGGFTNQVAKAAYDAQARLDRERGRMAHNANAVQARRHVVGPLPREYRERYTKADKESFDPRIRCVVCGASAMPVARKLDVAFKTECCPLGGTIEAVTAVQEQTVHHRQLVETLQEEKNIHGDEGLTEDYCRLSYEMAPD